MPESRIPRGPGPRGPPRGGATAAGRRRHAGRADGPSRRAGAGSRGRVGGVQRFCLGLGFGAGARWRCLAGGVFPGSIGASAPGRSAVAWIGTKNDTNGRRTALDRLP